MVNAMDSFEKLIDASLSVLGDTPDDIANNLFLLGCKGSRSSNCSCPLAHYFSSILSDKIRVGDHFIVNLDEMNFHYSSYSLMLRAPHVQQFIKIFDGGGYQFLI